MRNSELGCSGTEQRRGVAVALSCGDAAARGRWRGATAARRRGGAGLRRRGEAVTLWRGATNRAARGATGSARGPARRLMTSAKQAWLGQQHDMENLSKKIKNRFTLYILLEQTICRIAKSAD
ncbi:uncharacterized protein [Miscanthus floridulus]|uniref:uncharacterized protein isoform X2 n=1 Tax=Miscanthus floridulus TaxID=154761 RepID=UPI003458EEB2